ncbi:hypothetical protein AXK58_24420 [Tsukamurella tyrosinosolvens]|nr:hypothetical protein AXK58_24420 [Tsukamurella tyrosinosolvens]
MVLLPYARVRKSVSSINVVVICDEQHMPALDDPTHESCELITVVKVGVDQHVEPECLELARE